MTRNLDFVPDKVHVQDRIVESAREVFDPLQFVPYLDVRGDAKRIAADVDRALREVIQAHGAMTEEAASAYLANLSSTGRDAREVY